MHYYPYFLPLNITLRYPLSALLAMQIISSSYHLDPPHSSPASSLFLRRLAKSLDQSSIQITDEKAVPMFLNADLDEPQSKGVGICALPFVAASPIYTPTTTLSVRFHNESTSSSPVTLSSNTVALDTTISMASLPPTTPTWIATPPTPPYKNMRRCNTASARRSSLTLFTPSTSFPAAASPATPRVLSYAENSINTSLKRCTSLPSISSRVQTISKPRLTVDGRFVHTSPKDYAAMEIVADSDEIFGPEPEPGPAKLFHLPVTDNEDDGSPYGKDIPYLPEIASPEGSWSDHSVDDFNWGPKNRDDLRKFHALKELLATEVGYLKDLKALVTVTIFKFDNESYRLNVSVSERSIFVIFRLWLLELCHPVQRLVERLHLLPQGHGFIRMHNCMLQRYLLFPYQKPRMLRLPRLPFLQRNPQKFSHDTCSPITKLRP